MTTISAETILRSRNKSAPQHVLSTLKLRYPRCIHAEFMTHRLFSRNSASSRAIPVQKMIKDILDDPFVPLVWGKNQKGMQAEEECNAPVHLPASAPSIASLTNKDAWLYQMRLAVEMATMFDEAGYHKQIINRLLEPWMHITVVASSTEWANFIHLRDHPDAEPHMRMLARCIKDCLAADTIQDLNPGEWHTPFITDEDANKAERDFPDEGMAEALIKLSVARCASTSYKTVDGFDMTMERAVALHDKLVSSDPLHASPAEHVAQVDEFRDKQYRDGKPKGWQHPQQHGNFKGFRQYRKMLPNEAVW